MRDREEQLPRVSIVDMVNGLQVDASSFIHTTIRRPPSHPYLRQHYPTSFLPVLQLSVPIQEFIMFPKALQQGFHRDGYLSLPVIPEDKDVPRPPKAERKWTHRCIQSKSQQASTAIVRTTNIIRTLSHP